MVAIEVPEGYPWVILVCVVTAVHCMTQVRPVVGVGQLCHRNRCSLLFGLDCEMRLLARMQGLAVFHLRGQVFTKELLLDKFPELKGLPFPEVRALCLIMNCPFDGLLRQNGYPDIGYGRFSDALSMDNWLKYESARVFPRTGCNQPLALVLSLGSATISARTSSTWR
jgi:hypothetical protein